ncbi:PTS lactose/cellobiose transporter subunit IIA [Vagococcus carniphilus]|uniref:PTS system lactose-specific EIIA component n=1 Tax=Vagococcus carniphilus TaxID=218144 RepID=A0AAW8U0G5_9ENTE|nr:PTS lactose/cellobiose transporter subunit IIA [Vagococcus carniphilus]MDT2813907.1 PTS lactose/cellobiose transporter subunit IIA [Vagococcus carniphilus]MDT2832559.1 PTS lactose/cellobiose transporter subunit IIA [Vagococcus carniphilus]MDT2849800.1 PTS lactose/cellobiose transporter subunit IIA [Vagococcus carniphilus]MDT2864067.1 PTS lactose/cellobiose transporter subunit IIA [Vagococcus carniphilus]
MSIEEISFNLISLGGESFSVMMEALEYSEKGDIEKQQELMNEAEKLMNKAHNFQTKLLTNEAQGNKNEINVLLIHAQDTLMNTILAATLIKKMCRMNERLLKLEGEE